MKKSVLLMIVIMVIGEAAAEVPPHVSNGTVSVVGTITNDIDWACIEVCKQSPACAAQLNQTHEDRFRYNNNIWTRSGAFRMKAQATACTFNICTGKYECGFAMGTFRHVYTVGLSFDQSADCRLLRASVADDVIQLHMDRRPIKKVLHYTDTKMGTFEEDRQFTFSLECNRSVASDLRLYVVKYGCADM